MIIHIDMILQKALEITKPFTNKHDIFIGDRYQLPSMFEHAHAQFYKFIKTWDIILWQLHKFCV